MAALTATDLTVVVQSQRTENGVRVNRIKITLATAGSYPSNGIPWPSYTQCGMKRNLDFIRLHDVNPNANSRTLNDVDNSTFRVFSSTASATQEAEMATTVTLGSSATPFVLYGEAVGW
jgi:hypothetical protein